MGKSKLRRAEHASLGPQYAGAKIGRDAILEEDEHDPFAADPDGIESSDGASDPESPDENSAEDGEESVDSLDDEDDEDDEMDATDGSGSDDEAPNVIPEKLPGTSLAEVRKAARDSKLVAATVTQAMRDDIEKGKALKQQRTTFDALLNTRIKLQKALIGSNTITGLLRDSTPSSEEDLESAYQAAENAAFSLWSSLTSLRDGLQTARAGDKRKHSEFSAADSTERLWRYTEVQDKASTDYRTSTLEKWYNKTHAAEAAAQSRNRLNKSTAPTTIHDILNSTLSDSAHLLKRARTPRSCAPYQAQLATRKPRRGSLSTIPLPSETTKDSGDPTVYDDADFYSVLLTTLLEQRAATSNSGPAQTAVDISALNGYQIRREAKTRKNVDTKASKGRRLRYTPHEKLMNYMAPEDRGNWGERQVDELFGSLLGKRMVLDEEDEVDVDVEMEDEVDDGEMGLLFGR